MAMSGSKSVTVTNWDTLKFSWTVTSQSIANNTSTVSWKMELISGSSGAINSTASKPWTVVVDNQKFSGNNYVNIGNNSTKTLASGTKTITHNTDGTKMFAYSFAQTFDITFSGSSIDVISGSGSATLDTISRQAKITAAPNFNDEENPTITYSNPAGNAVTSLQACISLSGDIDISYRDIPKTGTIYTFNLTEAERNVLREATTSSNKRTVKFYVKTEINGELFYSSTSRTFTIINGTPTLSPKIVDNNATTIALTGDSNKLVRYVSDALITTGATAKKGAYIVSQKVVCGNKSITSDSGIITEVPSGTFVFTATDNRGNTVTQTVTKTIAQYVNISCNLVAENPSTEGEMTFTISGNYFSDSFGAKTNDLNVSYRYKANDDAYSDWITAGVIASDNTYTSVVTLSGLDYQSSYTIQANAYDLISEISSAEVKVKSTPVFDWGENDFNFNVPVNFNGDVTLSTINGEPYESTQKVLWEGAFYMQASHTIALKEAISKQKSGIVLIFSVYASGAPVDQIQQFFVSKKSIELLPDAVHTFLLVTAANFGGVGAKSLKFTDTTISGGAVNTTSGTSSSISYDNDAFVLRYVIGV